MLSSGDKTTGDAYNQKSRAAAVRSSPDIVDRKEMSMHAV